MITHQNMIVESNMCQKLDHKSDPYIHQKQTLKKWSLDHQYQHQLIQRNQTKVQEG